MWVIFLPFGTLLYGMKKIVSVSFVRCVPSVFLPTPCAIRPSSLLVERVQSADVRGSETSSFHSISFPVIGCVIEKATSWMSRRSLKAKFVCNSVSYSIAERAGPYPAVNAVAVYAMTFVVCVCV